MTPFCFCAYDIYDALTIWNVVSNKKSKMANGKMAALRGAANVVTTSTWCSLDACEAGNEESHTLNPFKEKRVCDSELSTCTVLTGTLNHNFRPYNRSAEDTQDTLSSVSLTLHVNYIIIISLLLLHPHLKVLLTPFISNGLLLSCITPAAPRTTPTFVNLPVPRRRGEKHKPPW